MTKKRAWTDLKRIPEKLVPGEFKEDGRYRPGAGYYCTRSGCGFVSKKSGFSGRQALRGHLKSHKRFARAWRRPLIWQIIWTAVSLFAYGVSVYTDLHIPEFLSKGDLLLLREVSSTVLRTMVPPMLAILVVAALLSSVSPTSFPTPTRARLLLVGRLSATFLLAAPTVWQLGFPIWPTHPLIPWLLWSIGLSGLWLAPAGGLMRLSLARRRRRSADYSELLKPKNFQARIALMDWIRDKARNLEIVRRQREFRTQPSRQRGLRPGRGVVVDQGRVPKPRKDHR